MSIEAEFERWLGEVSDTQRNLLELRAENVRLRELLRRTADEITCLMHPRYCMAGDEDNWCSACKAHARVDAVLTNPGEEAKPERKNP